jgi:CO/xanthine dehydrogenase FAD-binding subunit
MREFDFFRAESIEHAGELLRTSGGWVIAGGTDVIPRLQRGWDAGKVLIDISNLKDLKFIRDRENEVEIGALVTYADLLDSPVLQGAAPALLQAAATVGCPQTRSRGTIGGNIANASPAGDTLPPLLCSQAEVHYLRDGRKNTLALKELIIGPGETLLQPGDLLLSISLQKPVGGQESVYLKLGNRKGMNIAVASAAVQASFDPDNRIEEILIALGSVAPTPVRSPGAEEVLMGSELNPELLDYAAEQVRKDISPISDVRATAARRREAAVALVKRGLWEITKERIEHE